MKIRSLHAREVLATTAEKTVEVEIETERGRVRASVPIGTSTGRYEAHYLPVEIALNKIQIIKRKFTSQEFSHQSEVDNLLKEIDGTNHFREIGANSALAISTAFLKAFALKEEEELFKFVENSHPAILNTLRDKKAIDDDLKATMKEAVEDFKSSRWAERASSAKA